MFTVIVRGRRDKIHRYGETKFIDIRKSCKVNIKSRGFNMGTGDKAFL